jgi:hypothetical protein
MTAERMTARLLIAVSLGRVLRLVVLLLAPVLPLSVLLLAAELLHVVLRWLPVPWRTTLATIPSASPVPSASTVPAPAAAGQAAVVGLAEPPVPDRLQVGELALVLRDGVAPPPVIWLAAVSRSAASRPVRE